MKIGVKTLNVVANLLLAGSVLTLGIALWAQYRAPVKVTPAKPLPFSFTRGSKAPAIAGVNFASHERSLLVFVSTACHYCQASVPFYNRMQDFATAPAHDFAFYALFPESEATVRASGAKLKSRTPAIANLDFKRFNIHSTPTALLVDRDGIVTRFWVGASESVEADITARVSGLT